MALPLQHPVVRPNASGRRRPEDRDVSWRERLQALKHLPRLLRLVWETEPRYVVGILVLRVLALAGAARGALDRQAHRGRGGARGRGGRRRRRRRRGPGWASCWRSSWRSRWWARGWPGSRALLESLLGDLFANRTSVELMRHAATLDLEQFENAEIYDKLERARRQTVGRIGLFTLLLASVQDVDHPRHPGRGARGVRALAAGPAGDRGAPLAPGRDPLRLAGLLAALLLDARATPARLPALHRRERHLGEGAQALRPVGLPGRPLRPALPGVLRGEQGARGPAEPGLERCWPRSGRWATTRPTR